MYGQNRNITYLDDLPDLEELEHKNHIQDHPGGVNDKYKKFIRTSSKLSSESGMTPYNQQHVSHEIFEPSVPVVMNENNVSFGTPNCLDVHGHITQCPICSRFFRFDNTVYIIAIVVLSIICILLLKRVLNI